MMPRFLIFFSFHPDTVSFHRNTDIEERPEMNHFSIIFSKQFWSVFGTCRTFLIEKDICHGIEITAATVFSRSTTIATQGLDYAVVLEGSTTNGISTEDELRGLFFSSVEAIENAVRLVGLSVDIDKLSKVGFSKIVLNDQISGDDARILFGYYATGWIDFLRLQRRFGYQVRKNDHQHDSLAFSEAIRSKLVKLFVLYMNEDRVVVSELKSFGDILRRKYKFDNRFAYLDKANQQFEALARISAQRSNKAISESISTTLKVFSVISLALAFSAILLSINHDSAYFTVGLSILFEKNLLVAILASLAVTTAAFALVLYTVFFWRKKQRGKGD